MKDFLDKPLKLLRRMKRERGDIIDAFNQRIIKKGICPTLTTRPEGFKTAILVVVND